jgi:ribose transport system permease protein
MAQTVQSNGTIATFRGLATRPLTLALAAIAAMLIVGEFLSPGFAAPSQIVSQLTIAALLGIVAAGQNLVILGGREGIDLSVGGMISLGALVAGNVMQAENAAIPLALAATLAVTFTLGLVNGLGVTVMRIPPLVMTLGMYGVIQGALVVLTRGIPSGRAAPLLNDFVADPVLLGIPGILFVWIAIGIGMTAFLRRTAFGLKIFAIGTNEEAAALAGVSVRRTRVILFGLSGMFAGLTGFLVLGYTGNVFVGVGDQYILPSIIAVVIGGTSLAGGTGGYIGTMAGAVVLVLLQSILTTLNIDPSGRQIVFGATLLALMLLYGRQRKLRM